MSVWTELRAAVEEFLPRQSLANKSLGDRGERAADRFLRRLGYKIVARSYRNHIGEIDLIAVDQTSNEPTVVFVEVKTRQCHDKGHPVEAVDDRKQRQISETAIVFLKQYELLERRVRFDIVAITWPDKSLNPLIEHFPNAFEPTQRGQLFF